VASRPAAKVRPAKPARKPKSAASYDRLLKLAARAKPPQRWYDEAANPFKPEPRTGGR
jgi:hypothetical protein